MDAASGIIAKARHALMSEPLIGPRASSVRIASDANNTLTLEGEVPSLGAKKRALRRVAALDGVSGIVDRLRVQPATAMGDSEIADHLARAFLEEPAFRVLEVFRAKRGARQILQEPADDPRGSLGFEVKDGVVVLNGSVPGLDYKRLAGLLAWWVPGVCDVVNGIAVEPPEADCPELIEDAVRLAFEKDRLVNESQIRVGARDGTVRLTGLVATEAEREMAENDAWAIFGVDDVINHIEVRRPAG
jgi:osmotically-inducible protein OsmY